MSDSDRWPNQAQGYEPIVYEYCQLALRPTLDQLAAQRLGEILHQAIAEPLLSLMIDEADRLLNRWQSTMSTVVLQQQQVRLQQRIDAQWIETLLTELQRF